MVENLSQVDSGLQIFDQYEFAKRFSLEEKLQIIEEAIELGQKRAEEIKGEYGTKKPEELLIYLGLTIKPEVESKQRSNDYVKFAEYHVKSHTIYLNMQALHKLDKKLQPGLARDIILCHELYHYFEMKKWGRTAELFTRTVKLFGKIAIQRKIIPGAEIAADSFAKQYLKLDFNPQLIEAFYFD